MRTDPWHALVDSHDVKMISQSVAASRAKERVRLHHLLLVLICLAYARTRPLVLRTPVHRYNYLIFSCAAYIFFLLASRLTLVHAISLLGPDLLASSRVPPRPPPKESTRSPCPPSSFTPSANDAPPPAPSPDCDRPPTPQSPPPGSLSLGSATSPGPVSDGTEPEALIPGRRVGTRQWGREPQYHPENAPREACTMALMCSLGRRSRDGSSSPFTREVTGQRSAVPHATGR